MKKALYALVLATFVSGCGSQEVPLTPSAVQAQEPTAASPARSFVGTLADDPGEVSVVVTPDSHGNVTGRGMVFRGPLAYLVHVGGTLIDDRLSLRLYPDDNDPATEVLAVSAPLSGGTGYFTDNGRHQSGAMTWQERVSARMLDFQPSEGSIPEQFFLDIRDSEGIGYTANISITGYSSDEGVYTGTWTSAGPVNPNSVSGGNVKALAFAGQTGGLSFSLYGPTEIVAGVSCRLMTPTVGGSSELLSGSFILTPTGFNQDFVTGLVTVTNLGN